MDIVVLFVLEGTGLDSKTGGPDQFENGVRDGKSQTVGNPFSVLDGPGRTQAYQTDVPDTSNAPR